MNVRMDRQRLSPLPALFPAWTPASLRRAALCLAVAGGALLLLALAAPGAAPPLALAGLYARIVTREHALQLENRQRLLAALESGGPRTMKDLGDALGLDRSTIVYHVRVLERSRSVRVSKRGRSAYVHLPGQALPEPRAHAGGPVAEAFLEILRAQGGMLPRAQLHALTLDVPLRTRNAAIRALATAGLVERGFHGNVETLRLVSHEPGASGA